MKGHAQRDGDASDCIQYRIARKARAEKTARAKLAARRHNARLQLSAAPTTAAKKRIATRMQALRWVKRSDNKPGVFFGSIGGVRGYWSRPERSVAIGPRRKGVRTVVPRGRNTPKLILAFADRAVYRRPPLAYNETMLRVQEATMTSTTFGRELARIQSRRSRP